MSRWQPGDKVHTGTDKRSRTLTLGEIFSDAGQNSTIFAILDEDELLKLFRHGYSRPELSQLATALRLAFEKSDVVGAFPLALVYATSGSSARRNAVGYVMQRFPIAPMGRWSEISTLGDLKPGERLPVARQLVKDVRSFHAHGLIVGDFSLENLLVSERGAIAWLDTDSFGTTGDAPIAAPFGTPPWIAPEVARSEADCTQATDAYVVGLLVSTLLNPGMETPHQFERRGELDRDMNGRISDQDSWMLEPEAFKKGGGSQLGVAGFPAVLSEIVRALLSPHLPKNRPTLDDWEYALAQASSWDLELAETRARLAHASPASAKAKLSDAKEPSANEFSKKMQHKSDATAGTSASAAAPGRVAVGVRLAAIGIVLGLAFVLARSLHGCEGSRSDTGSGRPPSRSSGLGSAAHTAKYDMDTFSIAVTTEADWTVPEKPDVKSGGAMRVWQLFGPDGEEISIYHTPNERAKPGNKYVTDRDAFAANVSDAERVVLNGFPTSACASSLCDDYVLNGKFGGIAILAGDTDGPISAVDADIARSVAPK